jgi:uncharacterized protein
MIQVLERGPFFFIHTVMYIRRRNELSASRWSGGTTTELFIYPENASYSDRTFDLRISTATVELEQSDFTLLPGYSRMLMVLEGQLKMVHDTGLENNEVNLGAFEQSFFSGDWRTTGYGKVRDFNVLFKEPFFVDVKYHLLHSESVFDIDGSALLNIVFILSGTVVFDGVEVGPGEVVVFENELPLQAKIVTESSLIVVDVTKLKIV